MEPGPLVSVIVPTYYRNDVLADALESIDRQTYDPIEAFVVDDSGERHAEPIVESFDPVEYVPLGSNRGANVARTEGARRATGRYVQFLDDDDILKPSKIEDQVSVFQRHEDAVVVYSGGEFDDGTVFTPAEDGDGNVLERALTFDLPACVTSTMLIDADALTRILPLPDTPGADDTYLKIELARLGEFQFLTEPLVRKRDLPDSRGSAEAAVRSTERVLKEYAGLYQQFPDEVRSAARARVHYRAGMYHLTESLWSTRAVREFWQACRIAPEASPRYWFMLAAATLGRPGWSVSEKVRAIVR